MTDAISRQAAIDGKIYIRRSNGVEIYDDYVVPVEYLEQLPPAQPKRGKWNRLDMDTLNCNKCGATFVLNQGSEKMHFCPNCGADMRQREV